MARREGIKNSADLITFLGAKVKVYKENRRCLYPGCRTTLNMYNPNNTCDLHHRKLWNDNQHLSKRKGRWVLVHDKITV